MAYVVPQVLVFQEFQIVPAAITDPLRAVIVGPNVVPRRYSVASEKALIGIGSYESLIDSTYEFPARPAGGTVDPDSLKVFIDNATLKYYERLIGDAGTITADADTPNRLVSSDVVFADGNGHDRDADLFDRDVQPNDQVWIRGINPDDSLPYEQITTVRSVVAEKTAAVVGAATVDVNNQAATTLSQSISEIGTNHNAVRAQINGSLYDGREDGFISETYTVTVTQGSVNGDLTTAKLRVTSASGTDDDFEVTPAAADTLFFIGSRKLRMRFTIGALDSFSEAGEGAVDQDDLQIGQSWRLYVRQTFQAARVSSSGTYVGDKTTTYIVEVSKGGKFGGTADELPQVIASTTHGTDISAPITVVLPNTDYFVGTQGAKIRFLGSIGNPADLTGLRKGDKFYIPVTASADGRRNTLVLSHTVREELQSATDLDVKLYLKKNIELPKTRAGSPGVYNWEPEGDTEIVINSGAEVTVPEWSDNGVAVPLAVESGGTMYVEYAAWVEDVATVVGSAVSEADLDDIPGPLDPINPIKWGVYKAISNANGTPVKYIAVTDPRSLDRWQDSIATLVGRDDVYNVVPMTRNKAVLDLVAAHLASQSSAEVGRWRGAFFNLDVTERSLVVSAETSSDEEEVLATLADDPTTTTTVYRWLQVPADNAKFITNGVRAGDIVRTLFTSDGFGGQTYKDFVVDEVIAEDTLRLKTGHTVPVAVAIKIEVWHPNTKTEMANQIGDKAAAWGNRRIVAVWPDKITSNGVETEGYFLCAALAGLRSGIVPHRPMTNLEIAGFDDVKRTNDLFNGEQLNIMAAKGVWIVMKADTGAIITRHAVTTDTSGNLNKQLEMKRTNLDSISYFFLRRLSSFIGVNATDGTIKQIRVELESAIEYLINSTFVSVELGGQLLDGSKVEDLRAHSLLKNRLVARIGVIDPTELDNIDLYLVV
jgi:hypothetical protein